MAPTDDLGGAPPAMTPKSSTPKSMSSRLMTMKFMQRGAAQSALEAKSPSTPQTPQADNETSSASKRRKVSHNATPTPQSDLMAAKEEQARLAMEAGERERKRAAAIARLAAEKGDSHWVLDREPPAPVSNGSRLAFNIVQLSYAQLDHAGGGQEEDFERGDKPKKARQWFNMRKPRKKKKNEKTDSKSGSKPKKRQRTKRGRTPGIKPGIKPESKSESKPESISESTSESMSESMSESDPSDSDETDEGEVSTDPSDEPQRGRQEAGDVTPRTKRPRSSLSARRSEERAKAQEFAGKRRKKEVKLNQLTSISGGGSEPSQRPSGSANWTCHGCGKSGHKVADCPGRKR
ncbi:hypothetical protein QBC47DRAFT_75810 [Echria macrotheca]|uniref:CCHC-type domain-containing protein n=1 Tax=Echria macrotheca TaxID=438768 RepID=A0AAJ0F327_9PEZI|nr:hypothetical protein QBC47DRAFT_75810 [Echria macrotheca]